MTLNIFYIYTIALDASNLPVRTLRNQFIPLPSLLHLCNWYIAHIEDQLILDDHTIYHLWP